MNWEKENNLHVIDICTEYHITVTLLESIYRHHFGNFRTW